MKHLTLAALVSTLLLPSSGPAVAQQAAPLAAAPAGATIGEARLERLAEEIERLRVEHHVPGCALAVVHGDEVIFARGFGLADVDKEIPVEPETRFYIGSSTKAFTATLLGMLVDDGVLGWDDPVDEHLPYFTLAVDSEDDDARATLRDLLSHRTGFPRMSVLWAGGALSSEEILRRATKAEPYSPFRERWHYNNVMYLAAGQAGAAAAGKDWHALVAERILQPLEMSATRTTVPEDDETMARGYTWLRDRERLEPNPGRSGARSVSPVAPAGSISSNVLDMAQWLRFLLAGGTVGGKRLIAEETLGETWTEQSRLGGGITYGLGWMLRDWRGQRVVEHGGNVLGFSAEVAIFPDSDLGAVLLTNAHATPLQALAVQLVPDILLGDLDGEATTDARDLSPYLGKYLANFAAFDNETFTVLEKDGRLALDIPSQMTFELKPPDDEGNWQFALTDQIAVTFVRDDSGNVQALEIYQQGMKFEAYREGVELEPEVDRDEVARYLGDYRREEGGDLALEVLVDNGRLAMRVGGAALFHLHTPDDEGRWVARANEGLAIAFEEEEGTVTGLKLWRPNNTSGWVRLAATEPGGTELPTVDQILALRSKTIEAGALQSHRLTGAVRFPQAAVDGTFAMTVAGDDRLRLDIDLGRLGEVGSSVDGDRGWSGSSFEFEPFREMSATNLEQAKQGHPARLFGDWRRHFEEVEVLSAGELDGRKLFRVRLRDGDLPPIKIAVDAENGDILEVERMIVIPDIGSLPMTARFEDYREVNGMRIPFRQTESNDQIGNTVFEVEKVEVDLELADDAFVLEQALER